MNILFISNLFPFDLEKDKETKSLYYFADQWTKQGENVLIIKPVLLPNPSGIALKSFSRIGHFSKLCDINLLALPVVRAPYFKRYIFYHPRNFLKSMRFWPDIVVAHMNESFFWAWKIARYYQTPFVAGVHQSDIAMVYPQNFKKRIDKALSYSRSRFQQIFDYSSGIACRSSAIHRQLLTLYPKLNCKSFIAYSGIESSNIAAENFGIEKLRNWRQQKFIIRFASVASLIRIKNIDIVLRALAGLKGVNWSYTIAGEGPDRDKLVSLAKRLGIEKRVHFTGHILHSEVNNLLTNTDIFILVSAPETLGMAYLEAMGRSNIVIGTKGWGIDGIIKDSVNGFLCPPRDVEALYKILQRIIFELEESYLEELLRNAHHTILHYTREKAAKNYLDELITIVNKNSA